MRVTILVDNLAARGLEAEWDPFNQPDAFSRLEKGTGIF